MTNKTKSEKVSLETEKKISDEELELINKYTRKNLTQDDVYTFSVVLCDNDIDRDHEYFTGETLEKMAEMFVGVTGIYDHDPTAKNQVARIYSCKTENMFPKKTAYGSDYIRLVAKAYIPICEATQELISMLDSGIKKEVSVGCGIEECVCSICGDDMRIHSCGHVKGRMYGEKMCCGVLKTPTDAYEWSFTAVPSQRKAGVIKSFNSFTDKAEDEFPEDKITVSLDEYKTLKSGIEDLKKKADEGGRYKSYLELETVKAGITAKIGIESGLLETMVKSLGIDELLKLKEGFDRRTSMILPVRSQFGDNYEDFGRREFEPLDSSYSI